MLRTRDEVIEFFESLQETFPDARTASHEYLEGKDGVMVAGFRVTGTGRVSGVGAGMEIWQVWETRDEGGFDRGGREGVHGSTRGPPSRWAVRIAASDEKR